MAHEERTHPGARELTDDELDAVAGGALLEPIVSRNQPIPLKIDGIPGEATKLPLPGIDRIDPRR